MNFFFISVRNRYKKAIFKYTLFTNLTLKKGGREREGRGYLMGGQSTVVAVLTNLWLSGKHPLPNLCGKKQRKKEPKNKQTQNQVKRKGKYNDSTKKGGVNHLW